MPEFKLRTYFTEITKTRKYYEAITGAKHTPGHITFASKTSITSSPYGRRCQHEDRITEQELVMLYSSRTAHICDKHDPPDKKEGFQQRHIGYVPGDRYLSKPKKIDQIPTKKINRGTASSEQRAEIAQRPHTPFSSQCSALRSSLRAAMTRCRLLPQADPPIACPCVV